MRARAESPRLYIVQDFILFVRVHIFEHYLVSEARRAQASVYDAWRGIYGMVLELAKYPGAERVFSIGLMRCDAVRCLGTASCGMTLRGTARLSFNSIPVIKSTVTRDEM